MGKGGTPGLVLSQGDATRMEIYVGAPETSGQGNFIIASKRAGLESENWVQLQFLIIAPEPRQTSPLSL